MKPQTMTRALMRAAGNVTTMGLMTLVMTGAAHAATGGGGSFA